MRADIAFHLDGDLEGIVSKLVLPESPLTLKRKLADFYMLDSKNPVLDNFFTYGTQDSETTNQPLHERAQNALDFKTGTTLSYGGCNLNTDKVAAFKKIMDYILSQKIPAYMTVQNDEDGEEQLISGCNPLTDVTIQNESIALQKFLD